MSEAPIEDVRAAAYEIPTEREESDGTLSWDSVTIVVAEVDAAGATGLGYTYTDGSAAGLISGALAGVLKGRSALAVPGCWWAMVHAIRNLGWPGVSATAISALDVALWDLKGRLLDTSIADLLGRAHHGVPVYGSGGLTSYTQRELCSQLDAWVQEGIPRVKMKVGRDPDADLRRVQAVREAIGPNAELYVDANGAYSRKQALAFADRFSELGVTWFEEPVSSDDLEGLRLIRDRAPAGMAIAAGEYGYEPGYFRAMLESGAVDVIQADASRACGISGLQLAAAQSVAHRLPFSAHCAPSIHAHACCPVGPLLHCEYFHTHVRVEQLLFDGAPQPVDGVLRPEAGRPGLGLEFKRADAERLAR